MDVVYKCCCGVDIHKKFIVGCCVSDDGKKEIKTFGTMTGDLLEFCGWLKGKGVEMVAMESTASYWKPIFNLLEIQEIPAILVNAQHIKSVPGRKTDVKDAEWISDLLRHGLLKASFIPPRADRELKELVRYRISIIEERTREYNRMDKVLQGANIKLSSVVSTMDTKSGMGIVKAIVNGETDEKTLALLAKGSLKSKREELEKALHGLIQPHQQLILGSMLEHIESLSTQIAALDAEIDSRLSSKQDIVEALDEITGVGARSAQVILAEIGSDMNQFVNAKHLSAWAGVCPGKNESGGKKKRAKTRKGNPTLKKTLVQCGRAAARAKNTYISSMYARIAARRGSNIACVAVARTILEICYYMIRDNTHFNDLGADYFAKQNRSKIMKWAVKKLKDIGYEVEIKDVA